MALSRALHWCVWCALILIAVAGATEMAANAGTSCADLEYKRIIAEFRRCAEFDCEKAKADFSIWVGRFRECADQGYAKAQLFLGIMYGYGIGLPENDAEAAKWLRKAAERGHSDAQYRLGDLYAYGIGVPQDDTQAFAWLYLAAAQGNKIAEESKNLIAASMTLKEYIGAQNLAKEYWQAYVLPFLD